MFSFVILCVLLGIGHLLRMKVKILQRMFLPSSVIAGLLGLVVFQIFERSGIDAPAFNAILGSIKGVWGKLPGQLINIVFACLFIGLTIPSFKKIWQNAGPQFAYGQIVAWGQYVVGIGVFLFGVRFIVPGMPDMFGCVLPVGFEGGHGTAGGLADTFNELGWAAGKDYALASATAGVTSAVIIGMMLVNWAIRKGYLEHARAINDIPEEELAGILPEDARHSAGNITVPSSAVGALSINLVVIGLAVLMGLLLKMSLSSLGNSLQESSPTIAQILSSFPAFPLCMIGGLVVQLFLQKFDKAKIIDAGIVRTIMNSTLDFLVVAAIATIRIEVLRDGIFALILLVLAGILWNVFCVTWLARRVFKDAWFERAIAEMGQSMGVTATGVLLLRVVDPDYKTEASKAFAYKQIMHEPIMGGGVWTSAAIPLIAVQGGWVVFGITVAVLLGWLALLFVIKPFGKR